MDSQHFYIPRQTDRTLLAALVCIRNELQEKLPAKIVVQPHYGTSEVGYTEPESGATDPLGYVLTQESEVMPHLYLRHAPSNRSLIEIRRSPKEAFDLVTVAWENVWNQFSHDNKSSLYVQLVGLARKHLRAGDANASLSSGTENQWTRYYEAQNQILNSLQSTQAGLLADLQRKTLEAENAAKAKYDKLEAELRAAVELEREKLDQEYTVLKDGTDARETALDKREASFETKEAIYVARQKAGEQITDLKEQLRNWSLTAGTAGKRTPVLWASIVGLLVTFGLTVWFSHQTNQLLVGKVLETIHWWQWLLISLKTLGAFSAFISILVFFIKWSNQWAKQHAEEEFRTRARVLDIGRSMWLVEVVRDAHENEKVIPPILLTELSKNLFVEPGSAQAGEIKPQALTEAVLAGVKTLRVKTADGSEVEATRERAGKPNKG